MSAGEPFAFMRKPRRCPACRSSKIATIQYGLPAISEKLFQDVAEGKLILGGCVIHDGLPDWRCSECGLDCFKKF
jgi:rubredoxin